MENQTIKHSKHQNLQRASFGNFSRNELAFLGSPCQNIQLLFQEIIQKSPEYQLGIIEADHKAEGSLVVELKYTDKINFQRIDLRKQPNSFEKRPFFDSLDVLLVNGNHFEAHTQIAIVDESKPLEKKLGKLNNVALIIHKSGEIPSYLKEHLGDALPPIVKWEDQESIVTFIKNWIHSRRPALYGLVLAGGKSSRMGHDKGLISYKAQPQREFASQLISNYCKEVYLSLNAEQADIYSGPLEVIQDEFLNCGPLGGILSAFKKQPNAAWLVLACDMPFVNEATINYLVQHRNAAKFATSFKSPFDEFPEPLISIYEPRMYPKLLQMLAYGYDCPRKSLINSDINLLEYEHAKDLQNINTPTEFEKALIDLSPKIA